MPAERYTSSSARDPLSIGLMKYAFLAIGVLLLIPSAVVPAEGVTFSAAEHQRRTIYHSPQKPGFTSWVGAWTMPDGSLMVSFTQATG